MPRGLKSARRGSDLFEDTRERYLNLLAPLFFPSDPVSHDIIRFFSSLLRVVGMEDKGWDPYTESRAIVHDLHELMNLKLPSKRFADGLTVWRLGLTLYNHVIEMSAPYEVLANLLRFRLNEGYSPNPFYKYMTSEQRKRAKRLGLSPRLKIDVVSELGEKAGVDLNSLFGDFVNFDLRNAISHADFIIVEDSFRCRGNKMGESFSMPLPHLDRLLTSAKSFISAFFILEQESRHTWGQMAGQAIPYDSHYKGLMEVLSDQEGMMNGFKVHWPNHQESLYRRTPKGIDMVNCFLDLRQETIQLFVGMYARHPGQFSPLVELDSEPRYTPLDGSGEEPLWDFQAAATEQKSLPPVRFSRGQML